MKRVKALKPHSYGVPPKQYLPGDEYEMLDDHVHIMTITGNVRAVESQIQTRDMQPSTPKKYQRRDMKAR